jgi:predicted anti-sigma-YlaC factor YlaD
MSNFFNCQACIDLLAEYLDGSLNEETKEKLDEHLSACAPCINFLKTYDKSATMIKSLREQSADVPLPVQSRLKSFLRKEIVQLSADKKK